MNRRFLLLALFAAAPVWAQDAGLALCQDNLLVDRQPAFNAPDAGLSLSSVGVTPGGDLRLNTGLAPVSAEQIVLPFDEALSISYVYERSNTTDALGWLYYDDLIARGYVNTNGTPTDSSDDTLVDSDSDGIPDLHADLYNLSFTRPYVGTSRRCTTTFTHAGNTYYQPELASQACGGYFGSEALEDDRPPFTVGPREVVGQLIPAAPYTASATEFSDNGLFPQVPNLLEPRHPSNNLMGLGHLVFLNGDDDPDTDSYGNNQSFAPVPDVVGSGDDGIPDYNVTAYDSTGVPLASPPDLVVNGADRTVNLGVINGNREIVFFTLSYGDKVHDPTRAPGLGGPRVLPCLREVAGTCVLHLRTPVAVFFSKSALNLDVNPLATSPVVDRNIGCRDGNNCLATDGVSYDGWLELATLARLNTPTYGNLAMPQEHVSVARPANNRMPHAILGAPTTDPFRWVLGFENSSGGGDRDFNDLVVMIGKSSGGGVTSGVISDDIPASSAPDYTITQIRFERVDDVTRGLPGPPAWFEATAGACSVAPPPELDYFLSVDCRICILGVCTPNPTPTWFPVVFPAATPNVVVINPVDSGFIGSQLCWRAQFVSPSDQCQPTISDINIGYQAVKSGNYSRASVSPIANAVVFGSEELPGATWIGAPASPNPMPSIRPYDAKRDVAARGHLKLDTLYDPEAPGVDNLVERWDAGGTFTLPGFDPDTRAMFTTDATGARILVSNAFAVSQLFPLPGSCLPSGAPHDLNADGVCDASDATFLMDWLRGWENRSLSSKRAWPMGGLNFSTPSFVGPPAKPDWMLLAPPAEQAFFTTNFATPLVDRRAQTYVGTMSGVIHAFDSGVLRLKDDSCTTAPEYRGYFEHALPPPSCTAVRDYGTGAETFSYVPRFLLDRYLSNYTGLIPGVSGPRASADTSATVTDVDFGGLLQPWTISAVPGVGAKSVLVTSTGKDTPVVLALDVTNDPAAAAGAYPIPMWELDLSVFSNGFNIPASGPVPPVLVDGKGSRHAPFIGRFETGSGPKWLALVVTDFAPNPLTAGTLYFIDLITGQPYNLATAPAIRPAVVPLETDEGIAGEPIPVDTNGDGTFDVVYVPSTSGKVWRVSLKRNNLANASGQEILRCAMADSRAALEASGPLEPAGTQRIFSNIAVKVSGPPISPRATIFFGTADNPDDPTDLTAAHYYLLSYDDATPDSAVCNAPTLNFTKQLDADQRVWGGVTVTVDQVFVATAVGTAADACNLSQTQSGLLYTINQSTLITSSTSLGGHATSTPVLYDNHLFVSRASGGPRVLGGSSHNNPVGGATLPRSGVLMWDSPLDGKLPR